MSASLFRLRSDFRPYVRWLLDVAHYYGVRPRVTSTYRSIAEQRRLYRARQAGQHPYPVAVPGRSQHNYGLAADLVAAPGDLAWLGGIWQTYVGGSWSPRDNIHFGA